jgi:hypothetical protein
MFSVYFSCKKGVEDYFEQIITFTQSVSIRIQILFGMKNSKKRYFHITKNNVFLFFKLPFILIISMLIIID